MDDFDDLDALLSEPLPLLDEMVVTPDPVDYGEFPTRPFDDTTFAETPAQIESVPGQVGLFGADDDFKPAYQEWEGMPEFRQDDIAPFTTITVQFRNEDDRLAFLDLVGQRKLFGKRRSMWYPAMEIHVASDKRYRDATSEMTS